MKHLDLKHLLIVTLSLLLTARINASTPSSSINIAHQKPVTVYDKNNTPYENIDNVKSLNDGFYYTRWSATEADEPTLVFDLQQEYAISRVFILWEVANAKSYTIEVSKDSTNWTNVYSTDTSNGGEDNVYFTETMGRYVRLQLLKRGTEWNYSIHELEIFEKATPENEIPRFADKELYLMNSHYFDHLQEGNIAYQYTNEPNAYFWSDGGQAIYKKEGDNYVLSGKALNWGGGFNIIINEEVEDSAIYQIRCKAKTSNKERPLELWSNHAPPSSGRWQLATSNLGPGKLHLKNTEFTEVIFTHYIGKNYDKEEAVLQLEFAKHLEGGLLDEIEAFKLVEKGDYPPVFTQEIVDTKSAVGQEAIFFTKIRGEYPFEYQWYKDGELLEGENSSTLRYIVKDGDENAKFSISVKNAAGTINSKKAILTVENLKELLPKGDNPYISGTDTICTNQKSFKKVYTVEGLENADYYSWEITPAEAGKISNAITYKNENNITWKSDFSGNATITTTAYNQFGGNEPLTMKVVVDPCEQDILNIAHSGQEKGFTFYQTSTNQFQLNTQNLNTPYQITVFDILGNVKHQSNYHQQQISLILNETKGLYFIQLSTPETTLTKRVVIQ